ncbi:MAG: hypothetical protein LH615_13170 [Ferruginibacter sp.]|nr:hypothetical protein [Ferruginibacter sp.]
MKIILSLFGMGFSLFSFGQMKESVKPLLTSYSYNPVIYFDSILTRMDFFYFDTSKIKSINFVKEVYDSVTNSSGKIYITSKNPKEYNFLSFTDLKNKFIGNNKKSVLLLINGNFIKNPSTINIDSAYIYKVEVESGDDFEELKNLYPNLAIVNIKLNNLNNKNGERAIYLQGIPMSNFPE